MTDHRARVLDVNEKRAVIGVVNSRPAGDGIGYVGLLLQRAVDETLGGGASHVVAVDPADANRVRASEALSFVVRLALAQRKKPELPVIFNHLSISRAQQRLPARWRRPYAVLLNGVEAWDPQMSSDRQRAVRSATVRLAISHYTARRVAALYPEFAPMTVLLLTLLPEQASRSVADMQRVGEILHQSAGPLVVIVARMSKSERYKGHDELLDCWTEVRRSIADARLIVVGKGDDVDRLKAKAAALQLGESVKFAGFLSDAAVDALLESSHLFAMPSHGEGFGLAYLVAMRAGLPCIGTTEDAAQDVIVAGETGLLVHSREPSVLAASIVGLLRDDMRRRRMGVAGRRREREVFSFDRFRTNLIEALTTQIPVGPPFASRSHTDAPQAASAAKGER